MIGLRLFVLWRCGEYVKKEVSSQRHQSPSDVASGSSPHGDRDVAIRLKFALKGSLFKNVTEIQNIPPKENHHHATHK